MKQIIKPRKPFNFELICKIVGNEFNGREVYENALDEDRYHLVLDVDAKVIPIIISSNNSIENPILQVDFLIQISEDTKRSCIKTIEDMFDIKLDLNGFYNSIDNDPILYNVINRLYGLRSPSTPTLFEAFIRAFVEQQLPLKISNKIINRIIKNIGRHIEIDAIKYYSFPTIEQLARVDESLLRNCGLSRRKIDYIKNFSNKVLTGEINLDELLKLDDTNLLDKLLEIKGIGRWTAEYVMIRGMHRYSVTPADDLFLRKVISHYYFNDAKITGDKVREVCNRWGEWKGLASFYLLMDYINRGV